MSLQLWKKKMAIIAAMNKGYLLDVSGNPAVLTAALKKPLQGVTVYGASGGVGDATYNLFDVKTVAASLTRLSSSYPHIGRMYLQLHPDTDYTFWSDQPRYDSSGNDQLALAVNNGKSGSVISGTGVWLGQPRTVTTDSNGYLTVFSFKYGGSENWKLAEVADEYKFMAVEGAYTAETMPEYEPYGYKIPVLFGDVPEVGGTITTTWVDNSASTPVTYDADHDVVHKANDIVISDDEGTTEKTINGAYLQWHWGTPYDMPFDAAEAMYMAPSGGLAAGTYYFTVQDLNATFNGKTYMFTLNAALTEGMQLILNVNASDFTQSVIRVYDDCYGQTKNTAYGTSGDISVSLWDNESGLPLSGDSSQNSTNGAGELNYMQRIQYGYNRYSQSAIRQWLNSAEPARKANDPTNYPGWWSPQNKWDRAPAQAFAKPGFLSGYNADFIAAMRPVKVAQALNTKSDGGAIEYTYDKVFLPSLTEMNIQPQATEGVIWDYYKQLFEDNPVEGRTNWATGVVYPVLKSYAINAKSSSADVRLRSASRSSASGARLVNAAGSVVGGNANNAYRQRPACVIEINDNANKTINLYTPQQLTAAADTFAADIAAQTATLTAGGVSTDVSALQDWDQDFELTKGDNTVSIGTTVQPSAVEWRYLSSSRG